MWRRMMASTTWNSSADIGMTHSRSVFEGAITRRAAILADAQLRELQECVDTVSPGADVPPIITPPG